MDEILTKEFSLAEVLGLTSGYLLEDGGFTRIHELIEWLVGGAVFTHQIPYIAEDVTSAAVRQFPQLKVEEGGELAKDVQRLRAAIQEKNEVNEAAIWRRLKMRYGSAFQVAPMQPFDKFEQPPLITPNIEGKVLIVKTTGDEFPDNL